MAEHEQDKDVSRRYRGLGGDEPPPALDARIRAEARRAIETVAAPLVAPTGRRRWYFPVAAAAVIMLAVAVTSQVEREQPQVTTMSGAKEEVKQKDEVKQDQVKNEAVPEAKPAERRMQRQDSADLQAGVRAKKPQPEVKDQLAKRQLETPRAEERQRDQASSSAPEAAAESKLRKVEPVTREALAPSPSANVGTRGAAVSGTLAYAEAPEPWLERIAELRKQGKHEEADKALAEFRKRYPDFKIPPAMLEKVERK